VFYAAQVRRASALVLRSLAADVERWAAKLEKEGEGEGESERTLAGAQEVVHSDSDKLAHDEPREKPLIVELS
jgi:hypothetical protein